MVDLHIIPELNLVIPDAIQWSAENGMLQCNYVMRLKRRKSFVHGFCTFDTSRCRRKWLMTINIQKLKKNRIERTESRITSNEYSGIKQNGFIVLDKRR